MMKNFFKHFLLFLVFLVIGSRSMISAQNCTVNAGGNITICGTTYTLQGSAGSNTVGNPTWTLVSKPSGAPDPVISNINSFTPNITGMTFPGNYVFMITQPCTSGPVATSQVVITAPGDVSTFTAGPDITNVNATTGTVNLNGVVPAGYTAQWRYYQLYPKERWNEEVTDNATMTNINTASPTLSLIKKANHDTDPAYRAILRITSINNPSCWYEDDAIVRFIPNPQINVASISFCGNNNLRYANLLNSPIFDTTKPNSAGNASFGTTVTLNVISQPAGGNMSYQSIDNRDINFNGITVPGLYTYTVTVSNSSGTYTTPQITFNYLGQTPKEANFIDAAYPEQMGYRYQRTYAAVYCNKVGDTNPITFYYKLNPSDPPSLASAVSNSGAIPPGGSPSLLQNGVGTMNRSVTVTPPAGGWRAGTYVVRISLGTGCILDHYYYIHISDGNRPNVAVNNMTVCYSGSGSVSATIPLPAVYQGVINSSYFQDFAGRYDFTLVSKPAGSGVPVYQTTNFRTITNTSTIISNLDKEGEYVFKIKAVPDANGVGPFLDKEYACAGTSLEGTFSIFVSGQINANAGSDQTVVGTTQATLNGNNPGVASGTWTLVSKPSGAADPVIVTPSAYNSNVTGLNTAGTYTFRWTITTGTCTSADDVDVIIPGSCVNSTPTIFYNADNAGNPYGNTGGTGNLLPFVTVSTIGGGTYYKTTGTETLNGVRPKSSSTLFSMSGITNAVQASKYYSFNITTASNAPILHFNRFSAIAMDVDLILSPGGMPNVSYNLRVAIVDPDTGSEVNLGNVYINTLSPVDLSVSYRLKPGKVYLVKLYPWNTNGRTITYLDNPRLYFTPVPSAPASACLPSLSGTVGTALASYITNTAPAGMQVRWLQNGTDVTGNSITAGTYTPVYYNTSGSCYADTTGDNIVVTLCSADIQVNKVGPLSAQTGSTISYTINITNNGPNNAANVVVKDPTVANFTATGITCTAGTGTLSSAQCPASVTLAGLQGATGLTIPSLPEGSGVTFTLTGTADSTVGAVITNTATTEYANDNNTANNSSTVNTTIYGCTGDESTYSIDADATLAANTIAVNGGTVNLVYKLTSGTAVPGIGNQFTLPVQYSDLNNNLGVDNQWESLTTLTIGVAKRFTIQPRTTAGTGRIYNSLPTNNSTSEVGTPSNNYADNFFTPKIANGELDPLGKFSTSIGSYPAAPLGYVIKNSIFRMYSNGNTNTLLSPVLSGFWQKPLVQTGIRNDATQATYQTDFMPGDTYIWRYTAFSNGTDFVGKDTGGVKGVHFSDVNSITFAKICVTACYKPGATGSPALDTKVGITSLGRAGVNADNWPMTRKGGWIGLESKTKGFVPNRVAFDASGNPVGIAAANFVEGMMVYDITNKCMKIYTTTGSGFGWYCLTTQTCPDGVTGRTTN